MIDFFQPLDFYCERLGPEFWAEPSNAFSNIFIFLAGAYYWRSRGWVLLFSVVSMLTGVGSFLFHTTAQTWSLFCDVIPIGLLIVFYAYFSFRHILNFKLKYSLAFVSLIFFAVAAIEILLPRWFLNGSGSYLPAFAMLAFITRQVYKKGIHPRNNLWDDQGRLLLMGTTLFAVSLVARSFDQLICETFPVGTHFIWHSLNGCMIFLLIRTADLTQRRAS